MNLPERSYQLILEHSPHTVKYRNYIDRFVQGLEKKSSTTQVRFFWGILKPNERNQFVKMKQDQIKGVACITD